MYGVCDGHGPFGHLVSLRLVQTIPYYLTKSEHFGKNWEEALKEAFGKAQEELEEFCILVMETDVFAAVKTVYKRLVNLR